MLRTRVIPVLLLKGAGLVKTVKFKDPKYVGDPINAVKIFNEKEVDELVFLDIEASKNKKPINFQVLEDIASEAFMPLGYGGGISSMKDAERIFKLGFEKIVINSYAHQNPEFIKEAAQIAGSSSVVVSIDVKKNFFGKYEIYTHGGTKGIGKNPVDFAKYAADLGAGEIFLNAIDKDGMQTGFDINLIKQVSEKIDVPLIACGGAKDLADLAHAIKDGKASAVAAGSMFVFYGKHRAVLIQYPQYEALQKALTL